MGPRSLHDRPAGPAASGPSIVTVGSRPEEVRILSRQLADYSHGRIIRYAVARDFLAARPAGPVDLAVLAAEGTPPWTRQVLETIQRLWPNCLSAVLADANVSVEWERIARLSAAWYLCRPAEPATWQALVESMEQVRAAHLTSTS